MEDISTYELAQQRIEQRQRKKNHMLLWLSVAAICILLSFVAGNCVVPPLVIAVIFAVYSGIEWYFTSSHWTPAQAQVEQEMAWLFGEDWQDSAGVYEFSLALERILKRRKARVRFAFHVGIFLLANLFFFILIIFNVHTFHSLPPIMVLAVPVVWFAVLAYRYTFAFPTQRWLAQREQHAGEAIRQELDRLQPSKLKNEDKLKHGVYYALGDDGELVEIEQESLEDEGSQKNTELNR